MVPTTARIKYNSFSVSSTPSLPSNKAVLTETAKLAEQAYDKRTEKMTQATEVTNAKIQSLIEQYKGKIENDAK